MSIPGPLSSFSPYSFLTNVYVFFIQNAARHDNPPPPRRIPVLNRLNRRWNTSRGFPLACCYHRPIGFLYARRGEVMARGTQEVRGQAEPSSPT
jgi:hypothetical protein